MPWTVNDLPPSVEGMNLTEKEKEQFVAVANSILKETGNEGRAIAGGIAAVRKKKEHEKIEEIKRTSEVQSVAFKKNKFTKIEATAWLKNHDMKYSTSRETENEIRFRQTDPNKYDEFRIKEISDGINFIIGIINQKLINNIMETKNLKFEVKIFDEEKGIFEGYASVFGNEDAYGDIVHKGAFLESLSKRKPKLLWQHKIDEPIGIYTEVREDEKGLFVKGSLETESDFGKRVYNLLKKGALDGLSIGYSVAEGGSEFDKEKQIRNLKKVNLFEISLVTMPANDKATLINVKDNSIISPFKGKNIEQFDCMKDFENFLKEPYSLTREERKIFISKLKEFSKRDVEKTNERDVQIINECKKTVHLAQLYLLTKNK